MNFSRHYLSITILIKEITGHMEIEIYDYKTNLTFCKADVIFGLDTFIIRKCIPNPEIENNPFNIRFLSEFFETRAELPCSIDTDKKVLNKLGLLNKANLFGRMNEACILYAMLNNFVSDNDDLEVFPMKDEIICIVELDQRYSNIYVWHKRRGKRCF